MLVIGDSHARRLQEVSHLLEPHLQDVRVEWLHRGGAGISLAEQNISRVSHYSLVILMLGGNDLANGMTTQELADRVNRVATEMLQKGPDCIIVPSIWPRWDDAFNVRVRKYADFMDNRHMRDPGLVFWRYDNRQSWRTYDGIHLLPKGYERATRTLVSMIVWTIHHNQW